VKDEDRKVLKYAHSTNVNAYVLIPTVAAIVLGLLIMTMAVGCLGHVIGIDIESDTYNVIRFVFACADMAFAYLAMKIRFISEGLLLLITGLSAAIFSVSETYFGMAGLNITYLFFSACFIVCCLAFRLRHNISATIGTGVFAITIVLGLLLPEYYSWISGVGFFVSGVVFFCRGSRNCIRLCAGQKLKHQVRYKDFCSQTEYAGILVSTAGVLCFAAMSFVMGFYIIDETGQSDSLYAVKLILSLIVLGFSMYGIGNGHLDEGLMMFTVSLSTFMFAVCSLFGYQGPLFLDLILSFSYLPLIVTAVIKRKYIMTLTALLLFMVMSMEMLTEDAEYLELVITILKIVTSYTAVAALLYYETGRDILPKRFSPCSKEAEA
jgi:hypothetical protein